MVCLDLLPGKTVIVLSLVIYVGNWRAMTITMLESFGVMIHFKLQFPERG